MAPAILHPAGPMNGITLFQRLAKQAPHQLYRYGIDWDRQKNDPSKTVVEKWEAYERHSLQGVMDAYAYAIRWLQEHPNEHLKWSEVRQIHILATQSISCKSNHFFPGELRAGYSPAFGLTEDNCSEAGLIELTQEFKTHPAHLDHILSQQNSDDQNLVLLWASIAKEYYLSSDGRLTVDELEDFADLHSSNDQDNPRYAAIQKKFQDNLTVEVSEALQSLQESLLKEPDLNRKLKILVQGIRRLEHIHPFQDGNCRVFCNVLLNVLLLQNGFSPALIDNPNKFDGYSADELIAIVKDGMKRSAQLVEYVEKREKPEKWMLIEPSEEPVLKVHARNFIAALL